MFMVSKVFTTSKGRALTRLFFVVFAGIISLGAAAQNISDHYISSIQEEGILYFVKPREGFRDAENHNKLIYDLTYLSAEDSVTLNFTYEDDRIIKPQKLTLANDGTSLSSPLKKIYIESEGNGWEYRYSASFPFNELRGFYTGTEPKIMLEHKEGSIPFEIKSRKWEKQSAIVSKILQMITLNE